MCARIFKKRTSSKKFFASMLSVVVSFAVSSALSCMEEVVTGDVTEESSLVINSRHIVVSIINEEKFIKVTVDPELLEVINPKEARVAAQKITYCLYLFIDPDYHDAVKGVAKSWDIPTHIDMDNFEQFKQYLGEIAQAIAEQDILGKHIRKLSDRNRAFIKVLKEYQAQEEQFEKIISEKVSSIQKLEEELDKNREEIVNLQYDKQFLWYIFPPICMCVGVVSFLAGKCWGGS